MANFFTNLFETTGRGIGSFEPISLFQRITGHRQASRRTRDLVSDPVAFFLRRGGHLQGAEDWQKGGGIAQTVAAAVVASIFGGGALAGAGGGGGGGGGGGFAPGTAATQEGMGLGGLFGQGMEGASVAGGGAGGLFNNISRPSNLPNFPTSSGQDSSTLRRQMILDEQQRQIQEEQRRLIQQFIDELLSGRPSGFLR